MTGRTVADELARWIRTRAGGVVHLVAGAQIDPLVAACADAGVRLVPMATEFGAAAAADARARATGGPAVVLTIAGPGLGNAVPALASARHGHGAVVAISGDVPRSLAGAGGFQDGRGDTEVGRRALGCSRRVDDPQELAPALSTAESRADRRAGTHLVIPWDVQQLEADCTVDQQAVEPSEVSPLAAAPDPTLGTVVVLAAPCGPDGITAIERFADRGGVVLATVDAAGVLDQARVFGVVDPATGCDPATVLVHPRTSQVVVIDGVLDERTLGRPAARVGTATRLLHVAPHADGPCSPNGPGCHSADVDRWLTLHLPTLSTVAHEAHSVTLDEFDRLVAAARRAAGTEAHVVVDAGRARSAVARTASVRTTGRILSATTEGPMGWSLGATVGAADAAPGTTVLAVLGDGSCLAALGELATIGASGHDIRVLLLVNGGYGTVRSRLPAAARAATDVGKHVDWVALATSLGLRTTAAATPQEVEAALRATGPSLVVTTIRRQSLGPTVTMAWRGVSA